MTMNYCSSANSKVRTSAGLNSQRSLDYLQHDTYFFDGPSPRRLSRPYRLPTLPLTSPQIRRSTLQTIEEALAILNDIDTETADANTGSAKVPDNQ